MMNQLQIPDEELVSIHRQVEKTELWDIMRTGGVWGRAEWHDSPCDALTCFRAFVLCLLRGNHVSLSWPRFCRLWKWASLRMLLIWWYETRFVGPVNSEESAELTGLQGPGALGTPRLSTAHWLLQLPTACSGLLIPLLSLLDDWNMGDIINAAVTNCVHSLDSYCF